ncbi:MAG: hypothetical protein ACI8ZM_001178 [Crocinitomix sp.]|jgi:hypothetical protein
MHPNQFETFVLENKDLDLLINKQNFGVLSSIKKTDEMTPEFIDWISPKYYDAFVKVYKKHYLDKRGVVYSLFRTSFLANQVTLEKISNIVVKRLNYILERTKEFHDSISINPNNCSAARPNLDFPLDREATAIFENFKSQIVEEKKVEYRKDLMAIAKILKQFTQRKNEIEFGVYMLVCTEVVKLNLTPEQKRELEADANQIKLSGRAVWPILGSVIVLIIIMLRCAGSI